MKYFISKIIYNKYNIKLKSYGRIIFISKLSLFLYQLINL